MNNIRCHKQNDSPNRNDLSSFLKVVNDVEVEWRAGGKLLGVTIDAKTVKLSV